METRCVRHVANLQLREYCCPALPFAKISQNSDRVRRRRLVRCWRKFKNAMYSQMEGRHELSVARQSSITARRARQPLSLVLGGIPKSPRGQPLVGHSATQEPGNEHSTNGGTRECVQSTERHYRFVVGAHFAVAGNVRAAFWRRHIDETQRVGWSTPWLKS